MHGKTEARSMDVILTADSICKKHDELRETCGSSTIWYDRDGIPCDSREAGAIALSTRESYTIMDVLDMMIQTSQPTG